MLGIKAVQSIPPRFAAQFYNQIYPSIYAYKAIQAFKVIDIINAVINKLAKTAAALPIYGYDANGEDLGPTDKLTKFLQTLTFAQRLEMYTWLYVADEVFVYKEKTLGVNGAVQKVHFINPYYVRLVISDTFPQEIIGFIYCDPNVAEEFPIERDELIFIKGFNPTLDPYQRWRGLPKTDVLCQRLTRVESNMKNSISNQQNGGVPGVIFQKDMPNTDAGKKAVSGRQDNFARFISNSDNKGAPYFAAGEMGYLNIGSNLVDLESIELEKLDKAAICAVFGLSDILMNSDSTSTESNVKEMVRQMYTNAVKPYTTLVDDAFNTELVTDFGVGYRKVRTDYSDVPELQTSLKERIDSLAAAPVMIPNDVLEALGYDRDPNPLMDLPLIKTGYQSVDDFEPLPPVTE